MLLFKKNQEQNVEVSYETSFMVMSLYLNLSQVKPQMIPNLLRLNILWIVLGRTS